MKASVSDPIRAVLLAILEIWALVFKKIFNFFIPNSWRFKDIKGEIAVVTGAGSGLGRLLAVELARRDAIVVLWDVNVDGNAETQRRIKEEGGTSYAFYCDVSKPDQVYDTARKVKEQVGVVSVLFNNAGILVGADFMDIPDSKIRKMFEVNAMGPMWTCKAFLPDMMENNHGHIVNVASMGGLFGSPKLSDYCATKFALVGFDESLKIELFLSGHNGVRTTLVCSNPFRSGLYRGFEDNVFGMELSIETVCHETMVGFLAEEQIVLIPRVVTIMTLIKPWIPADIAMRMAKLTGLYDIVRNFSGARPFEDNSAVIRNGNSN